MQKFLHTEQRGAHTSLKNMTLLIVMTLLETTRYTSGLTKEEKTLETEKSQQECQFQKRCFLHEKFIQGGINAIIFKILFCIILHFYIYIYYTHCDIFLQNNF